MYINHFGLNADPFRLSPDHHFCFRHTSFVKAKAYMEYALHRQEGFVVVTGVPGTGKTTLIGDLLSDYNHSEFEIARLVGAQLEGDDLLRMVSHAFNVPSGNHLKSETLNQLHRYVTDIYTRNRRPLLIIDEAQGLDRSALEELRLLTNLQIEGQPLLQIFLVGQHELRELILDPTLEQLHQRIVAACHLEPLSPMDTAAYVMHRLKCTGWIGQPIFDVSVFPELYNFSRGIPRRINLAFSRLLLHGSLEGKVFLDQDDIKLVVEELRQESLSPGNAGVPVELKDMDVERLHGLIQPEKPQVAAPPPPRELPGSQIQTATEHEHKSSAASQAVEGNETAMPAIQPLPETEILSSIDAVDRTVASKLDTDRDSLHEEVVYLQPDQIVREDIVRPRESKYAPGTLLRMAGTGRYLKWTAIAGVVAGVVMTSGFVLTASDHQLHRIASDRTWGQVGVSQARQVVSRMSGGRIPLQYQDKTPQISTLLPEESAPVQVSGGTEFQEMPPKQLAEAVTSRSIAEPAGAAEKEVDQSSFTPVKTGGPSNGSDSFEDKLPLRKAPRLKDEEDEQLFALEGSSDTAKKQASVSLHLADREPVNQEPMTVREVLFGFDSTEIPEKYLAVLDDLADTLTASPGLVAHIVGFTDSVGNPAYNASLAKRRASSVAQYFIKSGVSKELLVIEGRGADSTRVLKDRSKQRTVRIQVKSGGDMDKIVSVRRS
ncbi:MAG: AAA family ATPase [Gammaproteobacteria bacterium]|nr:AAA family ATPase [Gammaproteobacteria bacterium]